MPSLSDTLAVAIGAFAVALVATPLAMRLATRVQLVDRPGPLKPQASATPYLGGVAIALGLVVGTVAYRPLLLIPLGMALAIGTADDVRPLPPVVRLAAELLTAVVLAFIVTTRFTGIVSILLVVLATVVLVNGFNLIDGLDGLCGSVSLASAVGFAVVLGGHGRYLAVALAGAVAAFLVFNRPPARIYLGDGGSYLIGTATAASAGAVLGSGRTAADRNRRPSPCLPAGRRTGLRGDPTVAQPDVPPDRRSRSPLRPARAARVEQGGRGWGLCGCGRHTHRAGHRGQRVEDRPGHRDHRSQRFGIHRTRIQSRVHVVRSAAQRH